jgi:hypothetical protein
MMEKLTGLADYLGKIPAAFLVAIVSVLAFILFLPIEIAKTLAVDGFRERYRVNLGPAFLLTVAFCIARTFIFLKQAYNKRQNLRRHQQMLHALTPEEKGYLVPYIERQQNSVYVDMKDGIMGGLVAKGIAYRASNMGDIYDGFAYNLQPWARSYLEQDPQLLDGHAGEPLTPQQRSDSGW